MLAVLTRFFRIVYLRTMVILWVNDWYYIPWRPLWIDHGIIATAGRRLMLSSISWIPLNRIARDIVSKMMASVWKLSLQALCVNKPRITGRKRENIQLFHGNQSKDAKAKGKCGGKNPLLWPRDWSFQSWRHFFFRRPSNLVWCWDELSSFLEGLNNFPSKRHQRALVWLWRLGKWRNPW